MNEHQPANDCTGAISNSSPDGKLWPHFGHERGAGPMSEQDGETGFDFECECGVVTTENWCPVCVKRIKSSEHDEFEAALQEVMDAQSYATAYLERGMIHRVSRGMERLDVAKKRLRAAHGYPGDVVLKMLIEMGNVFWGIGGGDILRRQTIGTGSGKADTEVPHVARAILAEYDSEKEGRKNQWRA